MLARRGGVGRGRILCVGSGLEGRRVLKEDLAFLGYFARGLGMMLKMGSGMG